MAIKYRWHVTDRYANECLGAEHSSKEDCLQELRESIEEDSVPNCELGGEHEVSVSQFKILKIQEEIVYDAEKSGVKLTPRPAPKKGAPLL